MPDPRQGRSSRAGALDLATRVRVVQAAYSDAQHVIDTILTRSGWGTSIGPRTCCPV